MLTQDEEMWEKSLPLEVEELLTSGRDPSADRNKRMTGKITTNTNMISCYFASSVLVG